VNILMLHKILVLYTRLESSITYMMYKNHFLLFILKGKLYENYKAMKYRILMHKLTKL
jgi:hypothetical protein